jgi:2-dehydro-3-deoxyphosphogluconate aldolase/(4S)-4-hydroxy-2-oxoglutarate aldolase
MTSVDPIDAIERSRLLVIIRRPDLDDAIVDALRDAGIKVIEISLVSERATQTIARWRERHSDLVIGAGTVTSADDAERAVEAGASFLVSPGLHPGVTESAQALGVPSIPGALTPTEIHACTLTGARLIKLFPASQLGPGYLHDLQGPFPDVRLLPTGGIDEANARDFLDAGAAAVAVGGAIVRPDADPETIEASARRLQNLLLTSNQGVA